MRRIVLVLLMLMSTGAVACAPGAARATDPLAAMQARIIDVGDRLRPSVVHIEAAVRQNTSRNIVTGSGFLISPDGVVLTNEHVVERAEKVSIIVPGRPGRYPVEVVGADKLTDLAVLRISPREGEAPFPATALGDSDTLRVGQWVIAIGNPYGLDGTVSLGIVSAKGRDLGGEALLNDFIQTDAMIDRGSSGGPLVDLAGRVVGVNSRGQGRGIGFTIPINTAKRVADDLRGAGIARGYLGIAMQPLSRELASYWQLGDVTGVVVNGIAADSPAAQAGLRVGDILTRFADEPIVAEKDEDLGTLQRLVARSPVGSEVEVRVYREGRSRALSVRLGVQPKIVPDEEETSYGFAVQEVTDGLFRQHRLGAREGVLVSFVERGSEAAEAGMLPGDLLQRVEDEPVSDIASFRAAVEALPQGRAFLVHARRGDDTRFLLIVPRRPDPRAATDGPPRTARGG
jgi:serine protease Do